MQSSGGSEKLQQLLIEKARQLRFDVVKMIGEAGSGHPGGSLSAADIMAALYFHQMNHRPEEPEWSKRDRFVLSKGHAAPVLYAALAESGYFPRDILWTLRKFGSILQGHPDMRKVPGVEISAGSLGQGLPAANGMALAGKMDRKDYTVYVLIGDGECQEGVIWEAALFASHQRLDNLVVILDYNRLQLGGEIECILSIEPLAAKWKAFNWEVLEIDGHNMTEILEALHWSQTVKHKPAIIIAHTVKGKGVSFMEDNPDWHGQAPDKEQLEQALQELGGK